MESLTEIMKFNNAVEGDDDTTKLFSLHVHSLKNSAFWFDLKTGSYFTFVSVFFFAKTKHMLQVTDFLYKLVCPFMISSYFCLSEKGANKETKELPPRREVKKRRKNKSLWPRFIYRLFISVVILRLIYSHVPTPCNICR